jgi:N-acetylmuramoyl-L-alanine amidase
VAVPNNHKGVRWVTLQAGHYQNQVMPEELEHLTTHTGAYAAGVKEVDINVAVAELTAQRLFERGYSVQLLDATVPPSYTTDLFLSLHADGNADPSVRGFKAVAPWGSVPASDVFVGFLYEEYGKATGLPSDAKTSAAMANYYAFNPIKYRHAINPQVPAALLEMGFVSNAQDRAVMTRQADRLAWGIANAVDRYFRSGAAGPTPSPYPTFTPSKTPSPSRTSTSTATLSPTPVLSSVGTPGVVGPAQELMLTRTARSQIQQPSPTITPLTGTLTADGRWLPPVAPNGRRLPPPGSDAEPVLLGEADDDPGPDAQITIPGWQPHIWRQYYIPRLGRSTWSIGPVFEPTPTSTPVAATPIATP